MIGEYILILENPFNEFQPNLSLLQHIPMRDLDEGSSTNWALSNDHAIWKSVCMSCMMWVCGEPLIAPISPTHKSHKMLSSLMDSAVQLYNTCEDRGLRGFLRHVIDAFFFVICDWHIFVICNITLRCDLWISTFFCVKCHQTLYNFSQTDMIFILFIVCVISSLVFISLMICDRIPSTSHQ